MKKRILSFFVVLAMLASVIVVPTTVSADASAVITNVKLTKSTDDSDPEDTYIITFDFTTDYQTSGNGYTFGAYTKTFIDAEYDGDVSTATPVRDVTDADPTGQTGPIFLHTEDTDRTKTQFKVTIQSSVYGTSGEDLYICYQTDDEPNMANTQIKMNADGSVAVDQTPVTLELDGGTLAAAPTSLDSGTYSADNLANKLGTPTKTGYKFAGWSESSGGTKISGNITLVKDTAKTFYALWTEKTALTASNFTLGSGVTYNGATQTVSVTPNGITVGTITVKYNGETGGKKDADTYAITIDVAESEDYKAASGLSMGNWTISKADYTLNPSAPAGTVGYGKQLMQHDKITGTLEGVVTADDITGTFAVGDTTVANQENHEYTGLSWTFTLDSGKSLDTTNYNTPTLTGNDGKLTSSTRTAKAVTWTNPSPVTFDGQSHAVTAAITGLTAGTDFKVQYSVQGQSSYTDTAPTAAGDYDVKVVLLNGNDNLYTLTNGTTTLKINKKTVKINAISGLTKVYDSGTTAKNGSAPLAITDLTLDTTGVNLAVDGTFSAVYNSANVNDATKITISGVTLSDTDNYALDATSLEMSATITALGVTATLKSANATKVYGKEITSLAISDFDYNLTATDLETELAGLAFTSDALAEDASVLATAYDVTVSTQPTSGNYNVTTTSKITVTQLPVTITVTPVSPPPVPTYKGSAFANSELVTVKVKDGENHDVSNVQLKYAYTKNGAATPTATVTDAGTYSLTVGLDTAAANAGNYTVTPGTTSVTIAKADYTAPATVEGTIPIGTAIENYEFSGSVKDVNDSDVEGKFKITSTDKGNAVEGQEYDNLSWTFTPTTANANYNDTLTGSNGKLTASNKTDNTKTPDVTATNATTIGGKGKLTIAKKAADTEISDTAAVEYKLSTATDWTNAQTATFANGTVTVDVDAGTYDVRYAETATTNAGQSVQATVIGLAANAQKPAVTAVNATTVGGKGQLVIKKADGDTVTSDTAAVEYKSTTATEWTTTALANGTATVDVEPGTYDVRYAATTGIAAGDTVQKTVIGLAVNAQKPAVTAVNATTVGGKGQLVIKKADGDTVTSDTAVVEYKLSTATDWTNAPTATFANGTATVDVEPGTYDVRYAATEGIAAGDAVQATVAGLAENTKTPAVVGAAPTTVGGKGTLTISKKSDDTVTAATATVQYRLKDTEDWTTATFENGTVTVNVDAGTYEVRYGATDGFAPGTITEVTVPQESTHKISVVTPAEDAHGTFTYAVGDGEPTSTATAKVIDGTEIKITATPDSGYTVNKVTVTKDGTEETVKTTGTYTFTMPDSDVTIEVTFKKKSSGGGGGGVSTYTVKYDVGDKGKITSGKATESVTASGKPKAVPEVTANEGYKFVGWTQDGKSTVDPTTVKITKPTTFTAVYEEVGTEPTPAPTLTPQVETAEHKAYIYGYEDDTFRPENGITRAETAAIFARALTDFDENAEYANTLSDIVGTEWFANSVNYLVSQNVITGYEDGTFRPYDSITRQEFATMIARLGEVIEAGEMPFSDVSEENWGVDYIYTAYANGWVSGYEDNTFRPENPITRAEAVRIVNSYLGRGTDEAGLADAEYTSFPDVATSHWAYYDIIEAANDHTYEKNTTPEIWVD